MVLRQIWACPKKRRLKRLSTARDGRSSLGLHGESNMDDELNADDNTQLTPEEAAEVLRALAEVEREEAEAQSDD